MLNSLERAIEIFAEICDLAPEEQAQRLALIEAQDPALREQVEELLLGDRAPDARLERQAEDFVAWQTVMLEGRDEAVPPEVIERLTDRGRSLARYHREGEVGRGGMGAVYQVWDEDLERNLAMKVLGSGEAPHSSFGRRRLQRFLDEARVSGQLDHPGIVPVHDLGIDSQGRAYFTMKFVKGSTLKEVFARVAEEDGEWTQARALGVLLRVCEAMSYAHAKGVVHRDLKPSNIMVGRFGEVYVMDWGVARLRSRRDHRDLRPKRALPDVAPTGEIALDSPVITMDGAVVGTPYFMSPEQARGGWVDERSDVYAMGAMLYTLAAGSPPYRDESEPSTPYDVLERVIEGPPPPLRGRNKASAELEAIYQKAMARAAEERYHSMSDLGDDLRAYLEGRVVSAHRTGAVAELRKWTRRNRALAASIAAGIVALVGGLVASVVFADAAQTQRRIALASENEARLERTKALRLSSLLTADYVLEAQMQELWPAHPKNLAAYAEWIDTAGQIVRMYPEASDELAALRSRARPQSEAELDRERRSHPKFESLQRLAAQLAATRVADAVRSGRDGPPQFILDADALPTDAYALNEQAWKLVDPDRAVFGREAEGLALANLAAANVTDDDLFADVSDTLAWALFANGLDAEARAESALALEAAGPARRGQFERHRARLDEALAAASDGTALAELEERHAALEAEVSRRRTWTFENPDDRWWHDIVAHFVVTFESLSDPGTGMIGGISEEYGWGIERRKAWAERVEALTLTSADASQRWEEAIASIADESACPAYGGLVMTPQIGLLPIGRDRDTGLWEFGHPQTGEVARPGADGSLAIGEETGLVFVLLPGGAFSMGAQSSDPSGPNHDPDARNSEGPVHPVTLAPFFLSKYEMTQAQWMRLAGTNPSFYPPEYQDGMFGTTLVHPVERVSWYDCERVCSWLGMTLPTEAQWEYAARAGTRSVWWTGDERESLAGSANLADRSAQRVGAPFAQDLDWPELDDGYAVHAPVNGYLANSYGLHNVHGNVWEWCRDAYDPAFYLQPNTRAPFNDPDLYPEKNRVSRGGSFAKRSYYSRSAFRQNDAPGSAVSTIGLRPARALDAR